MDRRDGVPTELKLRWAVVAGLFIGVFCALMVDSIREDPPLPDDQRALAAAEALAGPLEQERPGWVVNARFSPRWERGGVRFIAFNPDAERFDCSLHFLSVVDSSGPTEMPSLTCNPDTPN